MKRESRQAPKLRPERSAVNGPERFIHNHWIAAIGLAALVVVSFWPAIDAGFVWDDRAFTEAAAIRESSGLRTIWFSPGEIQGEGHYWPIVYSTFWLEHKLWGFDPTGYHIVNIALNILNCVLLWRLLSMLAVPGAWIAAALFAVHPVHVEAVAWVIERKDLLAVLFYLAAAVTWIRFRKSPTPSAYLLALVLFLMALLSKSIAVTLPVTFLILHWWKRGRATSRDWLRLAPFFAVAVSVTVFDMLFYRAREIVSLDFSLVERALIASRAFWFYLGKLMWPTDLAVIYPHWQVSVADPVAWLCLAAGLAVPTMLWLLRKRLGLGPLVGFSFFAITVAPALGLVEFGYMDFSFVADRYQYLASAGVLAVFAGAAARGVESLQSSYRTVATCVGGGVLVLLGSLSWQQAQIYKDEITFFTHVVSLNPQAKDAYFNLSVALWSVGQAKESLAASRDAIEQDPQHAGAHANAGAALIKLGRDDEAERHFHRALETDPNHVTSLQNLGILLGQRGRFEEAVEKYRRIVELAPDHFVALDLMGRALFDLKRYAESLDALSRAVLLQPDSSSASELYRIMGQASELLARSEDAKAHFANAIRLNPREAEAIDRLARLHFLDKEYDEACRLYVQLAEIQPESAQTHANLGVALYYLDRKDEALKAFQLALSIDPSLESARIAMEDLRSSP